jgi:outer membrane protein TolC
MSMFVNPAYYRFGVQVTDSLLNGGRNVWALSSARKTVAIERQRTLLLSLGILYEVDFRVLQVFALYDALVAREAVVTAQTETLKQVVSRYVQGLETGTETIRSLAEMYVARLQLDQARTEYLVGWFELDAATLVSAGLSGASAAVAAPGAALPPFSPAPTLDTYARMIDLAPRIDLRQYPELEELLRKADPKPEAAAEGKR